MSQNPKIIAKKMKDIPMNLLSAKSQGMYIREYGAFVQRENVMLW